MPYVRVKEKHRIRKPIKKGYLHNVKIGILILLVSIMTGIISVGIAGRLTRTEKKSSISATLIAGLVKNAGSIANLDPEVKTALKAQFDSMDSSEKEALINEAKEIIGRK